MIRFSQEILLLLHRPIAEPGGSPELRDMKLPDSAIEGVYQAIGGKKLCPTREGKGRQPECSFISGRAFVDGNKRIGMRAMQTFPEVIGIRADGAHEDVVFAGLSVTSGSINCEKLLGWVRNHRAASRRVN